MLIGIDFNLVVNMCFPQMNKLVFKGALPSTLLVLISLLLLWTYYFEPREQSFVQLILFISSIGFWLWISHINLDNSIYPGFLNMWCLICSTIIGIVCMFIIIHHRMACNFIKQKYQKSNLNSYLNMSLTKTSNNGIVGNSVLNDRLVNTSYTCFGNCNESCPRNNPVYISSNRTNRCCNTSLCAVSVANSQICNGFSMFSNSVTPMNSPGQVGFTQSVGLRSSNIVSCI